MARQGGKIMACSGRANRRGFYGVLRGEAIGAGGRGIFVLDPEPPLGRWLAIAARGDLRRAPW